VCVRWGGGIDENTRFATRKSRGPKEFQSAAQSSSKCPHALPPGTRGSPSGLRGADKVERDSASLDGSSRGRLVQCTTALKTTQASPSRRSPEEHGQLLPIESKSSPLARPSQRDNSRLSIQAPAARQTLDGIDARTALACSLHKALSFRAELNRPQQSAVQHVQRTCADVQKLDSGSWLRRTCRPRNVVVRNCPKGRREKLTTS
jgi:hypothetical protein